MQTYARMVNQYGVDALVGVWGDAYLQGNARLPAAPHHRQRSTAGGEIETGAADHHRTWPSPLKATINETLRRNTKATAECCSDSRCGNYIQPKDYGKITTPVPMDVPRIRYEFGTRRVGSSPPVANAGPNQTVFRPARSR